MAGTYLNAELLEVFLSTVPVFPIGMTIRVIGGSLAGCRGVVAKLNRWALDRPVVRLTRDARDRRFKMDLDLSSDRETNIESVL
jgi:hypothetical protein